MGVDKQYITREISKNAGVPEDKVKVAVLPQSKQVHIFVLKNMDEDDIITDGFRQYLRDAMYTHYIFAAEKIKAERAAE